MKTRKIFYLLSLMLIMGLYSGVIYASDENEGYNIESTMVSRNGQDVEVLQSQDGYLQITQIGQNSQNVKVTTSTFDENILVSGKINKGTDVTIEVYKDSELQNNYSTAVGITETFSQTVDVAEGNNKVFIYYKNNEDGTDNYVIIYICRESDADKEKLKTYFEVPTL